MYTQTKLANGFQGTSASHKIEEMSDNWLFSQPRWHHCVNHGGGFKTKRLNFSHTH
jgi:hypothetical protein